MQEEFRLELGLPCWVYRLPSGTLEKRVFMVNGQNSVMLRYRYAGEGHVRLGLRPFLAPRQHEAPISSQWLKLHPDRAAEAMTLLSGLVNYLSRRGWDRSARSSTPCRRSRPAGASPRRKAWPKC